MKAPLAGLVLGLLCAGPAAAAAPAVQTLDLPGGHRQRVLVEVPDGPARAALVMLPGGTGRVGLAADGQAAHGRNVLVRTAPLWLGRGYAVLVPDAVDGDNLRGLRSTPFYATVVGRLVALAASETGAPVILVGTSQGTIAAVNGAAHGPAGALAGLVLMEAVTGRGGSGETVFDASPESVTVPALVVADADDACPVAPPAGAARLAAALARSRPAVVTVSGGREGGRPCGSLSAHGYAGIEPQVVGRIADWIDARLAALAKGQR